jgi:hypothetical protein
MTSGLNAVKQMDDPRSFGWPVASIDQCISDRDAADPRFQDPRVPAPKPFSEFWRGHLWSKIEMELKPCNFGSWGFLGSANITWRKYKRPGGRVDSQLRTSSKRSKRSNREVVSSIPDPPFLSDRELWPFVFCYASSAR